MDEKRRFECEWKHISTIFAEIWYCSLTVTISEMASPKVVSWGKNKKAKNKKLLLLLLFDTGGFVYGSL